ncbi:hypothetical protein HAX54_011966, partial [Datura stramonium]|nr:hypothetical protein [Datura stramonium]
MKGTHPSDTMPNPNKDAHYMTIIRRNGKVITNGGDKPKVVVGPKPIEEDLSNEVPNAPVCVEDENVLEEKKAETPPKDVNVDEKGEE